MAKLKVHFMGIAGSGMAPIALLANSMGYEVSGCDLNEKSFYTDELKQHGISFAVGHDAAHVDDADIVTVTPAVFDYNPDHPELVEAKKQGKLMTWQAFSGQYLQKGKKVVAVCGTHGKSSTTSMAALMMERAHLDPTVEAGTIIKEWGVGYRLGASDYFVVEADEFNRNFLNYHPSYTILNNVEMDHPEFYQDYEEYSGAFVDFIKNLVNDKVLIVNFDHEGNRDVLERSKDYILQNGIQVCGYTTDLKNVPSWVTGDVALYEITNRSLTTTFVINGEEEVTIGVMGDYNVANAMGVYCLSKVLNIDFADYKATIEAYGGIARRLDKLYDAHGIIVYDDFAHHPTAIAETLRALRPVYKDQRLVGVIEPHLISRMLKFTDKYVEACQIPDEAIISKTFIGREVLRGIQPMDMNILRERAGDQVTLIPEFDDIADYVAKTETHNDVYVVCGCGDSYLITRKIVAALKKKYADE
ncbi:MAG: UDP-N-acetylmuramate--L-alanine ligase [bacterium]